MKAQLGTRKADFDGVAERQILRVGRFLAVCNGGGVAPAGDPFRVLFCGHENPRNFKSAANLAFQNSSAISFGKSFFKWAESSMFAA